MFEVIEKEKKHKMKALIICGIKYGKDNYIVYSIKRNNEEDNIFVSKIIQTSSGYNISNNFSGGEKEALDKVITRIINREPEKQLINDKINILRNIKLEGVNKFSIKECYVSTMKRNLIKELMLNYNLLDTTETKPIIKEKEISKFSKGSISSVFLIGFGVFILVFCLGILIDIYLK